MLKKIAVFLCVLFVLSASMTVFAGSDDSVFSGVSLALFKDIASGDEGGSLEMRGFTVSPDGKYLYSGFLQGYRHVTKYDATSGEYISEYEPLIENDDTVTSDNNYPKGLAVDNRGYLFVGITHANTNYISLACVDANMEEVSYITEDLGDSTGINGVATQKIGDRILCYLVTCYSKDTIRCYDVTDVKNIKPYDGFGVNGVVDYNELLGSQADPGYITVDVDGYVYICYKKDGSTFNKGSTIVKLDTDGKSVVQSADIGGVYGICTAGDYLFATTYEGEESCVYVVNKSDLKVVATLTYADQINNLSGIYYANGYLYVGDHGSSDEGTCGNILRSNKFELTRDSRETEVVVTEPLETKAPETDPPATDAPVTNAPETIAPQTNAPETNAPETNSEGTKAPEETKKPETPADNKKSNIGVIIGIIAGVVVIVAVVVVIIIKSKKK